jgi:lysyl-tRNA synthetase class 2
MADFEPTATLERLRMRSRLLQQVRAFFEERGFLEVETPLLSTDVVVDRHLDPFAVPMGGASGPEVRWLQTSPEFAMKRLLAAGVGPIFQVARAFRREESGPWHNPEFTLIEWYRPGDDLQAGMTLLAELAAALLKGTALEFESAERMSYQQAFERHLQLDPLAATTAELMAKAQERAVAVPESLAHVDRDGWLDLLMSELVQPNLGQAGPVIVWGYPPSQAALARVTAEPVPVAERFELFLKGVELANGYHELLDPAVLRERNRVNNRARVADGKEELPVESRLLAAMEVGLPACAGTALGFDRLLMLVAGATSIDEVLPFPWARA